MGIRFPSLVQAKKILKLRSFLSRNQMDVPKGHFAVYVGELEKRRYVVPISYLNYPSFRSLLRQAEEEFSFNHPMGGLTIPCNENAFVDLTAQLNASQREGRAQSHKNSDYLSLLSPILIHVDYYH